MRFWAGVLFLTAVVGSGCQSFAVRPSKAPDSLELAAREARLAKNIALADTGSVHDRAVALWVLPRAISEISGLALTADQRLLVHGDENGAVSEIDYRRGVVVKQFLLGKKHTVHADFEGITVAGDKIFMLASNGDLYEFKEGAAGERVDYTLHDTHLGKECEFEGVAYDPATASLLLACKHVYSRELKNLLVIYRWKLEKDPGPRLTMLTVPLDDAIGANPWKSLFPSDITIDPFNGNYILIAARQQALIEITPAGDVVLTRPLPGPHEQAEGVAITKDSLLLISDEAVRRPAVLTLYRWHGVAP